MSVSHELRTFLMIAVSTHGLWARRGWVALIVFIKVISDGVIWMQSIPKARDRHIAYEYINVAHDVLFKYSRVACRIY